MESYGPERVSERRGQSRMGIASFVIAVLAVLIIAVGVVLLVAFTGEVIGANPQSLTQEDLQRNLEDSPSAAVALGVAGFGFVAPPGGLLLGRVLGVAGRGPRRRKKLFAGLGTAVNGLGLLAIAGLLLLGVALGPVA